LVEALPLPVPVLRAASRDRSQASPRSTTTRARTRARPRAPRSIPCAESSPGKTSQAWAKGCDFSHDPDLDDLHEGQNIYAVAGAGGFPPDPTLDAEPAWAAEAADYDYSTNTCAPPPAQCGHYTQIVWRDSTFVGCGTKKCTTNSPGGPAFPNWIIVVCNYAPPGNVTGQRPY
jgi:hypothetical protein